MQRDIRDNELDTDRPGTEDLLPGNTDQARQHQTHPDQAHADQAHPDQTHADQAHADQTHAGQTQPGQTHADLTNPNQANANQGQANPERAATRDVPQPGFTAAQEAPTSPTGIPQEGATPRDSRQPGAHRDEAAKSDADGDGETSLFDHDEVERFREQWHGLQTAFVDDPQQAVHGADQLVAEVMQTLATSFATHKHELEGQWQQGSEVATEDLRLALRRYRTFFNHLLST